MLVGASQSVKELYLKRLSEDLNVSVSSLTNEILRGVKKQLSKKKLLKRQKHFAAKILYCGKTTFN